MGEIRGQLKAERLHFAQSAGEARRAAWRSFGGFWVWLLAMLATGALMGALGAFWITGQDNAKAFGRYPSSSVRRPAVRKGRTATGQAVCSGTIDPRVRQPPPGRNAEWAAAGRFPVIPTRKTGPFWG